jgi:dTDP-4-dehydrorhamnose reductase
LYGLGIDVKHNFFLWLYNNLKQGKSINVVTDQYNTPTLADDLAFGILQLIEKSAYGLFHMSGKEYINRYDFALRLADVFDFDKNLIHSITTDQLNQEADRPMKGGLKIDKAAKELNYAPKSIVGSFEYLKTKMDNNK